MNSIRIYFLIAAAFGAILFQAIRSLLNLKT